MVTNATEVCSVISLSIRDWVSPDMMIQLEQDGDCISSFYEPVVSADRDCPRVLHRFVHDGASVINIGTVKRSFLSRRKFRAS